MQDQASSQSSMVREEVHEIPPLTEELMDSCLLKKRESDFFKGITASRLTTVQWVALYPWTTLECKKKTVDTKSGG